MMIDIEPNSGQNEMRGVCWKHRIVNERHWENLDCFSLALGPTPLQPRPTRGYLSQPPSTTLNPFISPF